MERILPTCRAQIILSPGQVGSVLVGPTTTHTDIARRLDHPTVGVSFHAGGAQAFLAPPVSDLTDTVIDLSDLWRVGGLAEHLADLPADQALDLVEAELVRVLASGYVQTPSLAAAQAIRSGIAAADVPSLLGEDRRTLVPDFKRSVGVGLKHYERIRRFERAITEIRNRRPKSLALIAAQLCFADQAHLTRDVRYFAGMTPSILLGDGITFHNHVDSDKIFKT